MKRRCYTTPPSQGSPEYSGKLCGVAVDAENKDGIDRHRLGPARGDPPYVGGFAGPFVLTETAKPQCITSLVCKAC